MTLGCNEAVGLCTHHPVSAEVVGECSRWDKKGTWSPILDHVVQNLSLYVTAKLAVTETD